MTLYQPQWDMERPFASKIVTYIGILRQIKHPPRAIHLLNEPPFSPIVNHNVSLLLNISLEVPFPEMLIPKLRWQKVSWKDGALYVFCPPQWSHCEHSCEAFHATNQTNCLRNARDTLWCARRIFLTKCEKIFVMCAKGNTCELWQILRLNVNWGNQKNK